MKRLSETAVCAVSALFAALMSFLPFLIGDQGFFTLAYDYNYQQIPFTNAAQEGIRNLFSGEWIWNLDLGSSFITGFGFYNLGSPFFWITFFFPRGSFPYLASGIYVLKYMTAAILAHIWLKQFVKEERFAVLGGLLYAFCGFQSTNLLFYHFHDVVAFFPLLLLGMDQLIDRQDGLFFTFSVFLNCLINYLFFVQESIFLIIYFLFRYIRKDQMAESARLAVKIFLLALAGIVMAFFLFLPNIIYVMNSARGKSRFDLHHLLYDVRGVLFILKGFLFPGEAMSSESAIYPYQYSSTAIYLPFFGMSFVLLYLVKNRGWLRNMLITLILISFSPLIQSGFMLFTEPNQRWWYMLSLLCALATAMVLDRKQDRTGTAPKLTLLYTCSIAMFCLALWLVRGPANERLVIRPRLFLWFGGVAALFSFLCHVMTRKGWLNRNSALAAVLAAGVITTGTTILAYKQSDEHEKVKRDYQVGLHLQTIQDQYRYNSSENLYLLPGNGAGVGAFSSTAENSSYTFRSKVYDFNANFTYESIALPGLSELLGGKYEIILEPEDPALLYSFEAEGTQIGIAERAACPIGFATKNFIRLEELKKYPVEMRSFVLMDAVVVESPEAVDGFQEKRFEAAENPEDTASMIQRAVENRVLNFTRNAKGFRCTTDFSENQLVFFSVPNDAGWTASIDQEETEIVDSCGLMALRVPAGPHEIVFSYQTPGFQLGLAFSLAGWLVFGCIVWTSLRKRRNNSSGTRAHQIP